MKGQRVVEEFVKGHIGISLSGFFALSRHFLTGLHFPHLEAIFLRVVQGGMQ